jgi:aromatase
VSTRIVNAIVIDAPLALIWDMTNDVASWPTLFSEYAAAEILCRDDTGVTFRLTTHPDPEGRAWTWVSRRDLDRATHTVRARRIETGPFEYMNIYWEYRPVTGGVELRWTQEFQMNPGAHVDDAAMADHLNGNARVQMARIKDVIEKAMHRQATSQRDT